MKPQPADPAAQALAALSGAAQAEAAVALLTPRTRRDTLRAALAVLRRTPRAEARARLHTLFAHYARSGGAQDYGGYVRADILRALHPVARAADAPLLLAACATYEFPPPAFKEEGALLRSTALVALAEVDETLARYEAARLLADTHTDPNSGEPALTAARTLAAFGDALPLYLYTTDDSHTTGTGSRADVVAECLRGLTRLPPPLLSRLLDRYDGKAPAAIQVGLCDLLLGHADGPQQTPWLLDTLRAGPTDVAHYLLLALVAAGNDALLTEAVQTLGRITDPARRAAARPALELITARADVRALLNAWQPKPGRA